MRLSPFCLVVALFLGLWDLAPWWTCSAWAQGSMPVVRVRARSSLRLTELSRTGVDRGKRISVVVRARLLDERAGTPLAGLPVRFVLRKESEETPDASAMNVRTDGNGEMEVLLPPLVPNLAYELSATYGGDELTDPATGTLPIDLSRRAALLSLTLPGEARLGSVLPISVSLFESDRSTPIPGPVEVVVLGRVYDVTLRDGKGQTEVSLRPDEGVPLHGGKEVEVLAQFAGDVFYSRAKESQKVVLTTGMQVVLSPLLNQEVPQGESLLVSGRVEDEEGVVPGARLQVAGSSLASMGEREESLATVSTDDKGRFETKIEKLSLPLGNARLSAFVESFGHRKGGGGASLRITVLPPLPVPLLPYLLPLLGSALVLLLGFLGSHSAAIVGFFRRILKLKKSTSPPPPAEEAAERVLLPQPGVSLAPRRSVSALLGLRPSDSAVDGRVVDAYFGTAVSALLSFVAEVDPETPLFTGSADTRGYFGFANLEAGAYQVLCQAPGYLPQRFRVQIPHRGEYRGITISLMPIRVEIFSRWRKMISPILTSAGNVATWTPREFLDFVRKNQKEPSALLDLTDLVEEAYFSPRPCTEKELLESERLVSVVAHTVGPLPVEPRGGANLRPGIGPKLLGE